MPKFRHRLTEGPQDATSVARRLGLAKDISRGEYPHNRDNVYETLPGDLSEEMLACQVFWEGANRLSDLEEERVYYSSRREVDNRSPAYKARIKSVGDWLSRYLSQCAQAGESWTSVLDAAGPVWLNIGTVEPFGDNKRGWLESQLPWVSEASEDELLELLEFHDPQLWEWVAERGKLTHKIIDKLLGQADWFWVIFNENEGFSREEKNSLLHALAGGEWTGDRHKWDPLLFREGTPELTGWEVLRVTATNDLLDERTQDLVREKVKEFKETSPGVACIWADILIAGEPARATDLTIVNSLGQWTDSLAWKIVEHPESDLAMIKRAFEELGHWRDFSLGRLSAQAATYAVRSVRQKPERLVEYLKLTNISDQDIEWIWEQVKKSINLRQAVASDARARDLPKIRQELLSSRNMAIVQQLLEDKKPEEFVGLLRTMIQLNAKTAEKWLTENVESLPEGVSVPRPLLAPLLAAKPDEDPQEHRERVIKIMKFMNMAPTSGQMPKGMKRPGRKL